MRMEITDLTAGPETTGNDSLEQFAVDVLTGLCSHPKSIPAKYFYDDRGSEIFQRITRQSEYYLTAAEFEILSSVSNVLPHFMPTERIEIVELGPGDGSKSRIVIDGFLRAGFDVTYYPIDISAKALDMLAHNLPSDSRLAVHGIVAEYFQGLRHARQLSDERQLVLFLGSNIGNFDRQQSQAFLRRMWKSLNAGDHVFIGFDMKKDVDILTRAYNDSGGCTREFNLNLLRRINDQLGGDFRLDRFDHFGSYNPMLGAMESYLLSRCEQEVHIAELERSFRFDAYEPLHLEYSFKFLERDIAGLCDRVGFTLEENFHDSRGLFIDSLWTVRKHVSGPTRGSF